eukprot:3377853-Prymnesium_polylepis.1
MAGGARMSGWWRAPVGRREPGLLEREVGREGGGQLDGRRRAEGEREVGADVRARVEHRARPVGRCVEERGGVG